MKKDNTKSIDAPDSESLENLLFSGVIYRIISEPDGIRNSLIDLCTFLNTSKSDNFDEKIEKIESAMLTVDRIKDRDGAFTAFETLLQGSRYSLIIVDGDYKHIFHNEKSEPIFDLLFNKSEKKSLKTELILKINKSKAETRDTGDNLITIPSLIDNRINAYLVTNKHSENYNRELNILLIPNIDNHQFQIQEKLITKYKLTNKETLVLTNLIGGCDLQQISDQFCISLNTVRSHLKSIFRKTDTKSQTNLIRLFLNHESQLMGSYFTSNLISNNEEPLQDQFITLESGYRICYREYGPVDGRPLVIFHNFYGSRFNIPYDHTDALLRTNRRIIIPERPGYGNSDPINNYNSQWNEIFNEFIDKLKICKFDILGFASSTPLVIEYAAEHPNRVKSAILTSPLFTNTAEQINLLGELPYNASRMVATSKRIASMIFKLWMKSMKFDTERYIRRMINEYAGSAERHVLESQDYIDRIVLNFKESQRNNSSGSSQDAIYTLIPLELDLSKITVPFEIWIGDEDSLLSVSSAREICAPLPNKTFHVRRGYGEDIFYHLFEEIIQ